MTHRVKNQSNNGKKLFVFLFDLVVSLLIGGSGQAILLRNRRYVTNNYIDQSCAYTLIRASGKP